MCCYIHVRFFMLGMLLLVQFRKKKNYSYMSWFFAVLKPNLLCSKFAFNKKQILIFNQCFLDCFFRIGYVCLLLFLLLVLILRSSCWNQPNFMYNECYIVKKGFGYFTWHRNSRCHWFDINCLTVDSVKYWVTNNCHSPAASIWRKDGDHIDFKLSAKGDG